MGLEPVLRSATERDPCGRRTAQHSRWARQWQDDHTSGRIAYLVGERDVPPTSILAITFTTAAAATLRARLVTVLGSAATRVDIRTFHSFGFKVIRTWSDELGFGSHATSRLRSRRDPRVATAGR